MTEEEFAGSLKFNVLKYVWRYRDKGGAQDLEKAAFYLGMLVERTKAREGAEAKKTGEAVAVERVYTGYEAVAAPTEACGESYTPIVIWNK